MRSARAQPDTAATWQPRLSRAAGGLLATGSTMPGWETTLTGRDRDTLCCTKTSRHRVMASLRTAMVAGPHADVKAAWAAWTASSATSSVAWGASARIWGATTKQAKTAMAEEGAGCWHAERRNVSHGAAATEKTLQPPVEGATKQQLVIHALLRPSTTHLFRCRVYDRKPCCRHQAAVDQHGELWHGRQTTVSVASNRYIERRCHPSSSLCVCPPCRLRPASS